MNGYTQQSPEYNQPRGPRPIAMRLGVVEGAELFMRTSARGAYERSLIKEAAAQTIKAHDDKKMSGAAMGLAMSGVEFDTNVDIYKDTKDEKTPKPVDIYADTKATPPATVVDNTPAIPAVEESTEARIAKAQELIDGIYS